MMNKKHAVPMEAILVELVALDAELSADRSPARAALSDLALKARGILDDTMPKFPPVRPRVPRAVNILPYQEAIFRTLGTNLKQYFEVPETTPDWETLLARLDDAQSS